MAPNPADTASNKKVLDALYDLTAAHHYTETANRLRNSRLVVDLEETLELDSGSWRDPHPICYCWHPVSQKPKHKDIDECKCAFVFMYFKFYLGASWPNPAVTRFTNMAIVV